jgi:16S rRNA (uracil1498-N3)-methyltransferase
MRNRFYLPAELEVGTVVSLGGEELHHARVSRLRAGETVELFDGRGMIVEAVAGTIGSKEVTLSIQRKVEEQRELPRRLVLAAALIQIDRFELILQKATELGAVSFVPLLSERVEIRVERIEGKYARWEKIILEAAKQSGRGVVPLLEEPQTLREALARPALKLFFEGEQAGEGPLEPGEREEILLLIGPEGGWSEAEIAAAREAGCRFQRLGSRRLRAETAAITATALVAMELER